MSERGEEGIAGMSVAKAALGSQYGTAAAGKKLGNRYFGAEAELDSDGGRVIHRNRFARRCSTHHQSAGSPMSLAAACATRGGDSCIRHSLRARATDIRTGPLEARSRRKTPQMILAIAQVSIREKE